MSFDHTLTVLKAAADQTRLRLLLLLSGGEATVGELQEILEQSQPRVSRHLRLLSDAGLISHFRDGQWIYYGLSSAQDSVALVRQLTQLSGSDDQVIDQDRQAMSRVKRARERDAYSDQRSAGWVGHDYRGVRPPESELMTAIEDCVGEHHFGDVLDIGCGVGNLLGLFGKRARSVVGVDSEKQMRLLARSRIHKNGLTNCTVRNANGRQLPFDKLAFDLVVLDEVLSSADSVPELLAESLRVLRPSGHLIIVDRIQPAARSLPAAGNRSLIENHLTASLVEAGYKVTNRTWFPGRAMEYALIGAIQEVSQLRTGSYD